MPQRGHCGKNDLEADAIDAAATVNAATAQTRADKKELDKPILPPEKREALAAAVEDRGVKIDALVDKFADKPAVLMAGINYAQSERNPAKANSRADKLVKMADQGADPKLKEAAHLKRGQMRYEAHDYKGALEDAAAARKANPANMAAVALFKLSEGRGVAVKLPPQPPPTSSPSGASPAPQITPQAPASRQLSQTLIDVAARKLKIGDLKGAVLDASRAISADDKDPKAWAARAKALNALKDHASAASDAGRALLLDPSNAPALLERSYAQFQLGNYRQALEDAEAAIKLDGQSGMGYLYRAMAEEKLGDAVQAANDYLIAKRLDPALASLMPQLPAQAASKAPPASTPASKKFPWLLLIPPLLIIAAFGLFAWEHLQKKSIINAGLMPRNPGFDTPVGLIGRKLAGRYAIGPQIGRGGMGEVYEAADTTVAGRVVAIKVPVEALQDFDGQAQIKKEGQLHFTLGSHQHIAQLYDMIVEDGRIFLVFELIKGRTLWEVLQQSAGNRLSLELAAMITAHVGAALDHAHHKLVIHRDLKPSNIMLTHDNVTKVMDFGIARQAKDALMKTTGTIAGTAYYMAPEQTQGNSCKESDLYALSVCLYELLTGRRPFDGPGHYELKLLGKFTPVTKLVDGLPATLDDFFKRALDSGVEKRFHSGSELAAAFQKAIAKEPLTPR